MEKNGIKTDEYYKLMGPGDVQIGYISFTPYEKNGDRGYSIKCKVTCRCDRIVLCAAPQDSVTDTKCLIIRRINPNESGIFTYFNINRDNIDGFIAEAISDNMNVHIDLRYIDQTMCSCVVARQVTERSSVPEVTSTFDPFDTTNTAYSWDVLTDMRQLLEKNLIHGQMFVRIAMKALSQYEHLLVGRYVAQEGTFCIIGIPAEKDYGYNEFGRWVRAHRRYKEKNYNGYRLFYFNEANKRMVRPVLVRN